MYIHSFLVILNAAKLVILNAWRYTANFLYCNISIKHIRMWGVNQSAAKTIKLVIPNNFLDYFYSVDYKNRI